MSEQDKSFVVMKAKGIVSKDQYARLKKAAEMASDKIGMPVLAMDESIDVEMNQDLAPKLDALTAEQRKTNQLLAILIEMMADEGDDGEREPATFLDGTPVA